MSRPIILDCDPGHDDAVAILLSLASEDELQLLGITCVAGNVRLDKTARNARQVCELAGRPDTRVFAGCSRPMVRPLVTSEHIHGPSGLALPSGRSLPVPSMSLAKQHGVDFIIETCLAAQDAEITLCPTGPLTNIAMALVKEPRIGPKIREIVLMGGAAINPGNITPSAEFNIYVDPHAAHVVLTSGLPIVMMGLDVTHQVQTTPPRLGRIRELGTEVARVAADLLDFFNSFDTMRYGFRGAPLHDPCVIAYLLHPELFTLREVHVAVEISSETTLGHTAADWWGVTDATPNCRVGERVDDEGFYNLLIERLGRL